MLFWAAAIFLTVCAVLSVLLPFVRRSATASAPLANDLEVYRDQLAELDRDAARGLIGKGEAEEARAEIGRRILRAAGARETTERNKSGSQVARTVVFAAIAAVPLVSWGFYSAIGAPDLPAQPLAARLAVDPATASIDVLVARAEAHLQASPDDGRGWDVLAPIYYRLGRYADAKQAYGRAIELLGATANREAGLGEAVAAESGGLITVEAAAAFGRALDIEPNHEKSAFFLASALAQQGKIAEAADGWRAMQQRLPADSPWLGPVAQALAEAERRLAGAAPPQDGPSATDIEAAAGMSAEDREAMIASMVARLDERLKENPKDAEGWQRLVRSYVVLGKTDEARNALSRGMTALGKDTPEAAGLTALATSLGVVRAQ